MTDSLAHTPLHAWHVAHGGRMVDFAGWSMPVQYTSIVEEHQATRHGASLFDVSHMARFRFDGPDAAHFLDHLLTRRVSDLQPGRIRYSLVTADHGGVLDDILVYRLVESGGRDYYAVVANASNRAKIAHWITGHCSAEWDVSMTDRTHDTAMIAFQGPRAVELAQRLLPGIALSKLRSYTACWVDWKGRSLLVSRTGYTGEDGLELTLDAEWAVSLWDQLMDVGQAVPVVPAGLGARDTLRLEAAMPLYGHELTEQVNPIQAGLQFAVNLEGRAFPGHEAIRQSLLDRQMPRRIGLKFTGRRIPRQGHEVLEPRGTAVGAITSGTFSPTLDMPIAMAYVKPVWSRAGTSLTVNIRGQLESAQVVELPFYQRA